MAYLITSDDCIQCDVCRSECPNGAIFAGERDFEIDPYLCTECVGYFGEAQCAAGCPVGAINLHPDFVESREELEQKYQLITEMQNVC